MRLPRSHSLKSRPKSSTTASATAAHSIGIDQYQNSTDKHSGITIDPNNPDDEEYIVRLVAQVIRVSVETVKIVNGLPTEYTDAKV